MWGKMDQIIFCDIDGCLVEGQYAPFNMAGLAQVRHLCAQLAAKDIQLCLATGRPKPYAEAMVQVLGLHTPYICESGAYVYHPKFAKPILRIKDRNKEKLAKLRTLLRAANYTIEPGFEGKLRITWEGVSDMKEAEIAKHREGLAAHYLAFGFKWSNSATAVDVLLKGYSKRNAALFLLERYGLKPENAYAIGDSESDRKMLEVVEVPMCPANATPAIQARCVTVAGAAGVLGVVELLNGVLGAVSEPETTA